MTEIRIHDVWRHASGTSRIPFRLRDVEASAYPSGWTSVEEDPEPDRELFRRRMQRAQSGHNAPRFAADPVRAAVCVVEDPDVARLRLICNQEIQAAAATLNKAIEERLDRLVNQRVDAVLQERAEARLRASVLVQDFLSRLQDKAATAPLLPPEEAWRHVDFAAVYGEKEEEEEEE